MSIWWLLESSLVRWSNKLTYNNSSEELSWNSLLLEQTRTGKLTVEQLIDCRYDRLCKQTICLVTVWFNKCQLCLIGELQLWLGEYWREFNVRWFLAEQHILCPTARCSSFTVAGAAFLYHRNATTKLGPLPLRALRRLRGRQRTRQRRQLLPRQRRPQVCAMATGMRIDDDPMPAKSKWCSLI